MFRPWSKAFGWPYRYPVNGRRKVERDFVSAVSISSELTDDDLANGLIKPLLADSRYILYPSFRARLLTGLLYCLDDYAAEHFWGSLALANMVLENASTASFRSA